jgi:hypothetical protein
MAPPLLLFTRETAAQGRNCRDKLRPQCCTGQTASCSGHCGAEPCTQQVRVAQQVASTHSLYRAITDYRSSRLSPRVLWTRAVYKTRQSPKSGSELKTRSRSHRRSATDPQLEPRRHSNLRRSVHAAAARESLARQPPPACLHLISTRRRLPSRADCGREPPL